MFAVRTIDMDNAVERYYQRHYINIDREEFDQWLLSIVPAEVNLRTHSLFKSYEVTDKAIVVSFSAGRKEYREKANILVGADGACSRIRKLGFGTHPSPKMYISIQEWYETRQNADYYGAIFDSSVSDFYSWTIPKASLNKAYLHWE